MAIRIRVLGYSLQIQHMGGLASVNFQAVSKMLIGTPCALHLCTMTATKPNTLVTTDTTLVSACYRITFACPCGTQALREDCDIGANEVYGCASVRRALKNGVTRLVEA